MFSIRQDKEPRSRSGCKKGISNLAIITVRRKSWSFGARIRLRRSWTGPRQNPIAKEELGGRPRTATGCILQHCAEEELDGQGSE